MRRAVVLLSLAAALALGGCSQIGRDAVGKSLDAVNHPANRAKIEALLTSPEVHAITRDLTGEVLDAALEDLTGEARQQRLHELSVQFVEKLVPVIGETLATEVWPELERALIAATEKVVDKALSPEVRAQARELAADLTREAMAAAAPELSASISRGVSAGIQSAVAAVLTELDPLLQGFSHDPTLVRQVTREAAHGVLLGVADAMEREGEGFDHIWDRERDEIIRALAAEVTAQQEEVARKFRTWVLILGPLAVLLLLTALFLGVRLRQEKRRHLG